MPRKKIPQPKPIEVLTFPDIVIEVYDDLNTPRGRGLHRKDEAMDRETRAVSVLADLSLSKNPSDKRTLDTYLKNKTALANELVRRGIGEVEDRALRRTASRAIQLFKGLIEAQKSTQK